MNEMVLFDYLLKAYGYDEPILISEIQFENYSRPWLYKELNKLCKEERLIRFEKGLYYVPRQTMFGLSILNPAKVIEKKYVQSGENVFGYYSGLFFMNQIGLSNQTPNVIEIFTNRESAKVRDINVGSQKIRLRKARTEITKDNVAVLRFLELMNMIEPDTVDGETRQTLINYVNENGIRRADISMYSRVFPDRAMRAMIESEVVYSVAQ